MKEFFKKSFPSLYHTYRFYKMKYMDKKAIEYYTNLPESEYETEIKKLYKERVGRELNLDNPMRFSEKIQWRKLNEITPLISKLSDKYEVRSWVKDTIGEEYLIPLLGVWDSFDDINFDKLPASFVLKTNNASGTNLIVHSKKELNISYARRLFNYWLEKPFGLLSGLELQYCNIKPRIIAEKNMLSGGGEDLPDYKFFCFDGKVYCSYTTIDFAKDHSQGKLAFFDREYQLMPVSRADYLTPYRKQLKKPDNYQTMVEIAEKLSRGFSHVRVDLYNIDGKIYFGEMTFTTHSGYMKFNPDSFDYELGDLWKLPYVSADLKNRH